MRKVLSTQNGIILVNGKVLINEDETLPSGYTRVQYISASGSSAFDTNLMIQDTDVILVDFSLSSLSSDEDKYIISCGSGYSGGGLWVETYASDNKWYVRFGSLSSVNKASESEHLSGKHTFEVRKNYFGIDGSQFLSPSYSSMPSTTLNVGGRLATSGTTATGFYGNLYKVIIKDDAGEFKFYGIPAVYNNVAGIYDTVSNTFFTSDTVTAFTAGPSA